MAVSSPAQVDQLDQHGARVAYPQALAEQRMVRRWESYEALRRALPRGHTIFLNDDFVWVREVERGTGEWAKDETTGELSLIVDILERRVALSLQEAQDARLTGVQMDHWSGSTWYRRGVKPELDLAVLLAKPARRRQVLRKAAPRERALADVQVAKQAAAEMANVVPLADFQATLSDESHDSPETGAPAPVPAPRNAIRRPRRTK